MRVMLSIEIVDRSGVLIVSNLAMSQIFVKSESKILVTLFVVLTENQR